MRNYKRSQWPTENIYTKFKVESRNWKANVCFRDQDIWGRRNKVMDLRPRSQVEMGEWD